MGTVNLSGTTHTNAGTYNNGGTEIANYANGGSFGNTPGAAAFQTFTTNGNGQLMAERRSLFNQVTDLTGRIKSQPRVI